MQVGAFGIGSNIAQPIPDYDYDKISVSGIYAGPGNIQSNNAPSNTAFGNLTYGAVIAVMRTPADGFIICSRAKEIQFRNKGGSGWGEYCSIYSDANTTKTADGTLKVASPIVKIFSDGSSETNDESEGCSVERLSVGQYLITGCLGMNADGSWGGIDGGFDIPKDRNGQPLIWLDYEVNADGSVLVKTYHRTYPDSPAFARNDIPGLEDGQPVDIPADQFVSVRVEMPADSLWNQRQAAMQSQQAQE